MHSLGRQGEIDVYAFDKGRVIDNWPSEILFPMKVWGQYDDIFIPDLGLWAISVQAKRVVEQLDRGKVQYLPVSVIDSDTRTEIGPYFVLNVLQVVECINFEHTRWANPLLRERHQYPFLNILKEALNREAVSEAHIFRPSISQNTSRRVYISSVLKKNLEKASASKGMRFVPVPAY